MSRQSTKASRAYTTTTPIDIIAYRYNGKCAYVPVAPNYTQALKHARDAFPQLSKLSDAMLALSMDTSKERDGRGNALVRISASAWPMLITHMIRYQIIDVHVESRGAAGPIPDITITYADANEDAKTEPAPPYRGREGEEHGDGVVEGEKTGSGSHTRSRTSSNASSTLHPGKRSWFLQKLHGQR